MLKLMTYSVLGMNCGCCAAEVTKRLHTIEGIVVAHVDLATSTVEILMRHPINIKYLRAALRGTSCRLIEYVAQPEVYPIEHASNDSIRHESLKYTN